MRIAEQIDFFLSEILLNPQPDLSVYKNSEFCEALRKRALEDMEEILVNMHSIQLKDEIANHNFQLNTIINSKHPLTKLSLLDYCIIAGLNHIALRIAALNCETSIDISHFKQQLNCSFEQQQPEFIQDVTKTIQKIETIKLSRKLAISEPISLWDKFRKAVNGSHKYSLFLFITGICCIIGSPFSGGLSTILLLSIGIPSALASVPAFQAANTAKKSRDQVADQSRIYYEAKELRKLISITHLALTRTPDIAPNDDEDGDGDGDEQGPVDSMDIKKKLFFLRSAATATELTPDKKEGLSY